MSEIIPVLIACVCGLIVTPIVRRVSIAVQLVDHPDGRRKLHAKPIALGGGVAVFVSVLVGLFAAYAFIPSLRYALGEFKPSFLLGLFVSSTIIVCVGLIDDRYQLRGRQKLFGQIIAVSILMSSGIVVEKIQFLGWGTSLGLLSYPFTMFWLLGAINALNLIDGLDGLASSVGIVLSLSIAGMAYLNGHQADALIALVLCGAILGFVIYNLPPASIYLGDAGSMLIGLVLGALAMRSSFKAQATVALMAPTVIWGIPILDVGMAILRRKLTGRSIYETDRGHLHHCLIRSGFSGQKTLFYIAFFCMITGASAIISVAYQNEFMALIAVTGVFGTLVVTRLFGYAECVLVARKLKSMLVSLVPFLRNTSDGPRSPMHARLTGTRDWEDLWGMLTEYAERFDLSSVQLNVNLPALNEEYHVNWNRRDPGAAQHHWMTDIPLYVDHVTVGRLRITGNSAEGSVCVLMGELIAGLKPFEIQIANLISDQVAAEPPVQPKIETGHYLVSMAEARSGH